MTALERAMHAASLAGTRFNRIDAGRLHMPGHFVHFELPDRVASEFRALFA